MCGIAGFWAPSALVDDAAAVLIGMTDRIAHRGPDDEGHWFDAELGLALGHRRLSIVDLSAAGHQPMISESGRYVIVYNGEIYNCTAIRADIDAVAGAPLWRGHSDTEVLLAAIERWGVEETLVRLDGMFAFALWDREHRQLILARDRLGEKPLYYGSSGGHFLFGSELKALIAYPAFNRRMNRDALTLYLRHNYIPAPHCIWEGVSKLLPGHYVTISDGGRSIEAPKCYWDFRSIAEAGVANPLPDTPDLVLELERLLKASVGRRMVADVPLGAFLSGGVDSSSIVALMQAQSARPVRSFSIGFHETGYDEARYARAVAAHLGTDHQELYVTPDDARAVIPRLAEIWDEPFSDSSQIPTFLVSEMTRREVTVALSGDGGDELFGGYSRYMRADRLTKAIFSAPQIARNAAARLARVPTVGRAAEAMFGLIPGRAGGANLADRLPKLAAVISSRSPAELYQRLCSHWIDPAAVVRGGSEVDTHFTRPGPAFPDARQSMMYIDSLSYLPDDILTKVDRASMAVSLETRVPFLDHTLVAFAWQVPLSAKFAPDGGKHILRQMLARHLPRNLIERPKMGFGVPIEHWLSGPLRDWAEDLLDEQSLRVQGFFDPAPIRRLWNEHKSGARRWHYLLWDILMFQSWWSTYEKPHKI